MALTLEATIAIAAIGTAVLAAVVYFERRYMRSRRKDRIDLSLMKDDAYNALITTQAVANSLQEQGRKTEEADRLLLQAQSAYRRQDYATCKDLADKARDALRRTRASESDTLKEIASGPVEVSVNEQTAPIHEIKKLPQNYLESKFMIEAARMCIDDALGKGAEVKDAEGFLAVAKQCFERTEYTEALKQALRAKRSAEGLKVAAAIEVGPPTEREEAPADRKGAECGQCGGSVDDEDNFCRQCGAKIVRTPKCPSCSSEVEESDRFCRKCGTNLKET